MNNLEPTWTYYTEIKKLESQVKSIETKLKNSIEDHGEAILKIIASIKSDVKAMMDGSLLESKNIIFNSLSELSNIERSLQSKMDSLDKEHNQKNIQVYNTLDAYKKQVETLHFDIIDNEDNLAITYINPNGKVEYGAIKKLLPDNKTLKLDKDNKISWNYQFDTQNFKIENNTNKIKVTGLTLNDGKCLDAGRIDNDLKNATYNIKKLTYKLENALQKLNNINGYLTSNNFKKASPESDILTKFAIECLSQPGNKITIDLIPAGTKIKNTFDNHIWVFNRFTSNDGLTTYKWEDFGADNICIAGNDGVHGLVTGSHDHFKAFVDINGVVSINGLEEDFQYMLDSLSELNTQIKDMQSTYEAKLKNFELRLKALEDKNA